MEIVETWYFQIWVNFGGMAVKAVTKTIFELLAVLFNHSFSEDIFPNLGKWLASYPSQRKEIKRCLLIIAQSHF